MFGRPPERNDMMSGAFVGDIRAVGFDVRHAPTTKNPNHVRIIAGENGFDAEGREFLALAFELLGKIKKVK